MRSKIGVRGDSGVGLVVNPEEPWLMRIFGGAEEDGKEGGARSEVAMAVGGGVLLGQTSFCPNFRCRLMLTLED